jgi:hypothetical protein
MSLLLRAGDRDKDKVSWLLVGHLHKACLYTGRLYDPACLDTDKYSLCNVSRDHNPVLSVLSMLDMLNMAARVLLLDRHSHT